ncbi:glycosyltransferase family 4 protein [Jatrophihabitans telluris]|uniref:Glycosyltransferase family 4 protein n=1 Tax=Jatrophihabitans telluris TaxID=2038343 RepID=A0ABY4QX94_9ACTN|nr:glycosyltransferase family 4 protein [Jatrophihabitans telluris]UQX87943.1 glycosyltransferase family 4 protein [Jatrophihabitans telluris]
MRPLKVFAWAKDHHGCGNYRMGLPVWALNRAGHDALAFSVLNVDLPSDLDVLVGQIVAGQTQTEFWQSQARRADRSFAMVYEIDDDVWNLDMTNPSHRAFAGDVGEQVRANIEVADAVTVTTDYLAERIRPINPNVFVTPNCFDASLLTHERPRAEKLTVGWAGGSSHQHDFLAVAKDLHAFFKRNPQVDTHFIGVNHGDKIGRPGSRFSPWRSNLVEYMHSVDFDLGIAPLAYHAFNRSKSDLKFLEYSSLGIPVVASDFGPYSESIIHGVTGLKVKHPHEWARHLRALSNDSAMRDELGRNAKSWAAIRTIQANVWRWEDAYYATLGLPTGDGGASQSADAAQSSAAAESADAAQSSAAAESADAAQPALV